MKTQLNQKKKNRNARKIYWWNAEEDEFLLSHVLRFSKITQVEITGMELEKGTGISSWRKAMMETARECVEEEQDKQNLEECLLLSDRRNQKPAKFGSLSPFTFVL